MTVQPRIEEFNLARRDALRRIWFVGAIHGEFKHLALRYCAIKNGVGEEIFEGVEGW